MKLSILIADDHEVVRRGIRSLFRGQQGWRVCGEAATGREAIEKTKKLHPDLLLLGVTLPDIDTADAISQIKAACPIVKIVVMALPASGELAVKALAAGANGLAMKSDPASDLLQTVRNIGESRPFLSPAAVMLLQSQIAKKITSGAVPKDLTPRELQILKLLAEGQPNREVARRLAISVKTVDVHRANIMRKLQLATFSDLVRFAVRHELIAN
jgi:DNA-binding NarL/FixJ family response regulator